MSDKVQKTVRIKWIRSGIGFTHRQKRIVRSLGLRKLNQEVERPDTPQIRGLVAKVPHLVAVVETPTKPAWKLVPEYSLHAPAAAPAKPPDAAPESPAAETEKTEAPPSQPPASVSHGGEQAGEGAPGVETTSPEKSGIERDAEILRSAQKDSEQVREPGQATTADAATGTAQEAGAKGTATPSGEGSGSASAGPSPGEGQTDD